MHHIKASDMHEVLDILGSVDPELALNKSIKPRRQQSDSRRVHEDDYSYRSVAGFESTQYSLQEDVGLRSGLTQQEEFYRMPPSERIVIEDYSNIPRKNRYSGQNDAEPNYQVNGQQPITGVFGNANRKDDFTFRRAQRDHYVDLAQDSLGQNYHTIKDMGSYKKKQKYLQRVDDLFQRKRSRSKEAEQYSNQLQRSGEYGSQKLFLGSASKESNYFQGESPLRSTVFSAKKQPGDGSYEIRGFGGSLDSPRKSYSQAESFDQPFFSSDGNPKLEFRHQVDLGDRQQYRSRSPRQERILRSPSQQEVTTVEDSRGLVSESLHKGQNSVIQKTTDICQRDSKKISQNLPIKLDPVVCETIMKSPNYSSFFQEFTSSVFPLSHPQIKEANADG